MTVWLDIDCAEGRHGEHCVDLGCTCECHIVYSDGPLSAYGDSESYKAVVEDHRTDKGVHGYLPAYRRIANTISITRICELGVLGGASLAMWREWFPEALIVGVDNKEDAHWPEGTVKVVSDQDDPKLPDRLIAISRQYDLIIDDCSHVASLTARSFRWLWPLVAPGGYYVVEDWKCGDDTDMVDVASSFFHMLSEDTPPFIFDSVEYVRGNQGNSALAIVRKAF